MAGPIPDIIFPIGRRVYYIRTGNANISTECSTRLILQWLAYHATFRSTDDPEWMDRAIIGMLTSLLWTPLMWLWSWGPRRALGLDQPQYLMPCHGTDCTVDPVIYPFNIIVFANGATVVHMPWNGWTCVISNVVYAARCANCHEAYVGSTIRTFRTRCQEHLTELANADPASHLVRHEAWCQGFFHFVVLEWLEHDSEAHVRHREKVWQHRTGATRYPTGINTQ